MFISNRLISSTNAKSRKSATEDSDTLMDFYQSFLDEARQLGLEIRNEWIRSSDVIVSRNEQFGYEQFNHLWNQDDRPDGLVIYPDSTARGALMALLARHVSVPDELKLVIHKNDLCPYECPVAASKIVTNVSNSATELINMINRQIRGEGPQQVFMPFTLAKK